jgi:hypothetical protein
MQINSPDSADIQLQAQAAGFANVDEYVFSVIERDKDRAAIQEGLNAVREGRTRPFDQFDTEFRKEHGIRPAVLCS